jgi:hypothetical protein
LAGGHVRLGREGQRGMERIGSSGSAAGCAGGGEGATVVSPASEFDLAPSIWKPHTRVVYWRAWRLVATWSAFLLALGAVLSTSPRLNGQ